MTDPASDFVRLASALAESVGMPLRNEHLHGVAGNLGRLLAQGRLLMREDVAIETEPAPVFRP